MSATMLRLWTWVARHRMVSGWLAALLAVVAFVGGISLGATRAQGSAFREPGLTPAAIARTRATTVEVVVMGKRANTLVTRTRDGDQLIIRTTPRTVYRRDGTVVDAASVRRGQRLLILGRPTLREGVMEAHTVAIRGVVPAVANPTAEPASP